jgi:hypothetical protein
MAGIDQRREAEIASKLVRRSATIPARGAAAAPVIDGDLGDAAWAAAAKLEPFVGVFGSTPADLKVATVASVCYDQANLYIALRCDEPEPARMTLVGVNHDDSVWSGDSLDILLSGEAAGKPYIHLILNPKNVQWDAAYDTDNQMDFDPAWQSAVKIGETAWTVEMAIPWAALRASPTPGLTLRANLCRNRHWASELSTWSQVVRGFMEPEHFGSWTLQ